MPPKRQLRKRVAAIEVTDNRTTKRGRSEPYVQSAVAAGTNWAEDDRSRSGDQSDTDNGGPDNNINKSHVDNRNATAFPHSNISCAALENSMYNYSGTCTGCPRDWLRCYDRFTAFKGWNSINKAMAMPLYLRGQALRWFDQLPRQVQSDFDVLSNRFIQNFELSRSEVLAELDALVSRKQLPGEDLDSYLTDIGSRCRRLKRTPDQEFEYTLQGLQPSVKRQVLIQGASTIEDLRRIGKLCELVPENHHPVQNAQTKDSDSVYHLVASLQEKVTEQEATINQLKAAGKKQNGYTGKTDTACFKCGAKSCPGKSRETREKCFAFGKTCKKCSKANHFAKVCRTRVPASSSTESSRQTQNNTE